MILGFKANFNIKSGYSILMAYSISHKGYKIIFFFESDKATDEIYRFLLHMMKYQYFGNLIQHFYNVL